MAEYIIYSLVILIYVKIFIDQKKYYIKDITELKAELNDLKAKYHNNNVDYSKLASTHADLIISTDNQIFDLTLQLEEKTNDFKSLEKSVNSLKKEHEKILNEEIKKAREDTIKRSRSVLRGQASEHLAPFVIKGTNPKDYRFMGNPVDYICFDGLSDVLDKTSDKIEIVRFVDIKTGKSNLNKSQRRIRDAIQDGRVSFEIVNLDEVLNDNSTNQHEVESKEKS